MTRWPREKGIQALTLIGLIFLIISGGMVQASNESIWQWEKRPYTNPYYSWVQKEVLSKLPTVPPNFNPNNPSLLSLYETNLRNKSVFLRTRTEEQIRNGFSTEGPEAGRHQEFLQHVEGLAEYFYSSNDRDAGRKVAHILFGFERVSIHWPVGSTSTYPTYYLTDPKAPTRGNWSGKIWSGWFYTDVPLVARLARAFDHLMGAETGPEILAEVAAELGIEDPVGTMENFFVYWWRVLTEHWPPMWTNMDPQRILGMIDLAHAMGDPARIRQAIRWVDRLIYRGYYRDGMWHEPTPSYALMVTNRLPTILDRLQGYTDPVDYVDPVEGDRLENFDAWGRWGDFAALTQKALEAYLLPNGLYLALNDSHSNQRGTVPARSGPTLLPAAGLAVLGQGTGKDQFQLHLNFSNPDGHEHLDSLGITLWAHGEEILSEGEYHGNRDWQASTAAHNTVVVDETSQFNRFEGRQIPIDWGRDDRFDDWLNYHASNGNHTQLLLWDVNTPGIMLAEAAADAMYPDSVSRYQRLVASIDRPEGAPYIVDIFWVEGGRVHDWMIHGSLHKAYTIDADLNFSPRSGTYHKWIEIEKSATTQGGLRFTIKPDAGSSGVESIVLASETTTEVIVGNAPAMRRAGTAPFMGLRRQGPSNTFVVIHNPYDGKPPALEVNELDVVGHPAGVVAFEVIGPGFVDVVIATLDGPHEYPVRTTEDRGASTEAGRETIHPVRTSNDGVSLAGRFGWLRREGDSVSNALVVGGGALSAPDFSLEAPADLAGAVTTIGRASGRVGRTGPNMAGITEHFVEVEGNLPLGTTLHNQILSLILGDGSRHPVRIDRVVPIEGKPGHSKVVFIDDPGIEFTDDGVERIFFPNWKTPGPVRYEVLGRAGLADQQ